MRGDKSILLAAAVGLSGLWGCSGGYSGYTSIPPEGWPYNTPVAFSVDSCSGSLEIALRHRVDFPYTILWLEVRDSAATDTVGVRLCDTDGRWLGGGVGDTRQLTTALPGRHSSTRLNIRHIMRVDTLKGIVQIGLLERGR